MFQIRRTYLALAVAAIVALAGCNKPQPSGTPAPLALDPADVTRAGEAIAHPAWLRDRLPEHTVAYARLPSFWGMTSAPNGRALDKAYASQAHTKVIAALREAVGKDKIIADTGFAPALMLLLDDLAAPVEIAVVDGSDIANPASNILVSAELSIADVNELNARFAALGGGVPLLKAPLGADGKGQLSGNGFVHFDPATRRLHALFGMAASALALDSLVTQVGTPRPHAMQAIERSVDSSGQGLFFWMGLKGVNGMASAQVPAAKPGTLLRDFIDKSQSVTVGWGTAGPRGKLQMQLAAPQARVLAYFAPTEFKAAVMTAGKPSWALTMVVPTAAQLTALETNLDQDFGVGTSDTYKKLMAQMREKLGVELKDLAGLFGPEVIAFEDATGTYSALRVNDRKALYARIDEIGARLGWKREAAGSGKASVHHLYIPGINLADGDQSADVKTRAWMTLYSRIGSHLYWVEEGEYLIFGQVPQALADRAAATLDTDLGEWLRKSQSYDPATTLFGATGVTHNVQRKIYYAYLGGLQSLGDALGQPINLMELPNAAALDLPVEGAIGIAVDATPDRIGVSMTYEQNPAEILFGGGGSSMTAVAVVGILAAVALPAYQDYTVRAQVSQVLADAAMLKIAIAEYHATNGKMPDSNEDLGEPEFGESLKYLANYYVEDGAIVLMFGGQADSKLADTTLVLKPYLAGDSLLWQCADAVVAAEAEVASRSEVSSDVPAKFLPTSCR